MFTPDSTDTERLLSRVAGGDRGALGLLLERHRGRLLGYTRGHVGVLRARLDPSDVVQDAQMEAARRIGDYLERRPMPFHLWLRKMAYERLVKLRRDHVTRQKRSLRREASLPDRSSELVAGPLLAAGPSPAEEAEARERDERINRAVQSLPEADREVLLLRHAEGLPFEEIACVLGIEPAAARKRFGRALIRLQQALTAEGLVE